MDPKITPVSQDFLSTKAHDSGIDTALVLLSLLLTVILVLFPTSFRYNGAPVQSVLIFGRYFPVFSVLYYSWISLVLIPIALGRSISKVKGVILSLEVAFVQIIFWTIRTNTWIPKQDGVANLAYLNGLVSMGHTFGARSASLSFYAVWPGFQYAAAFIRDVLGAGTVPSMTFILSIVVATTSVWVFLFFSKVLQSNTLGMLSVSTFFAGSIYLQSSGFTPSILAYLFVVMTFWIIVDVRKNSRRNNAILILLVISLGFTNFISLVVVFSMFLAQCLFPFNRRRPGRLLLLSFIMLIMPEFLSLVQLSQLIEYASGLFSPTITLQFSQYLTSKAGGFVPSWVSFVTVFWQAIFVLSFAVGLVGLGLFRKRWNVDQANIAKGLLGLAFVALVLVTGGPGTIAIFLVFVPLLSIPFLLDVVSSINFARLSKGLIVVFILLVLVLTFPSVSQHASHPPMPDGLRPVHSLDSPIKGALSDNESIIIWWELHKRINEGWVTHTVERECYRTSNQILCLSFSSRTIR